MWGVGNHLTWEAEAVNSVLDKRNERDYIILLCDILFTPFISLNTLLSHAHKMGHFGPKTDTNLAITSYRIICMGRCRYLRRECDLTLPTVQYNLKTVMFKKNYTPKNTPTCDRDSKIVLPRGLKNILSRVRMAATFWSRPFVKTGAEIHVRALEVSVCRA